MGNEGAIARARRRIAFRGDGAALALAPLSQALGHDRALGDAADLLIVEGDRRAELVGAYEGPIVAVFDRRLKAAEREALLADGVHATLDTESSVLDAALAFSTALFETRTEQLLYGREFAITEVRVCDDEGDSTGRLLGVLTCGALVDTADAWTAGAAVRLFLPLGPLDVELKGRVAFSAHDGPRRALGIEFALEAQDVAPRLGDLAGAFVTPVPRSESRPIYA